MRSNDEKDRVTSKVYGVGVRLDNLNKSYGTVAAVRGVSMDIRPGEFLTLLGPSGSGKTTLLMMIAGFILPSSGDVLVNDRSVIMDRPHQRNMGTVYQTYALFPHMTVYENIAFPLQMRKVDLTDIGKKVSQILELVHLQGYERRYPRELSGGQQQRIGLARALVFEPPVLLMDEPLCALDKKLREQMQLEIREIQHRLKVTVIYVTHDQEEALTMSDRIAVMNQGRLVQMGTPIELYDVPASRFVADFIGESNLLDATLLDSCDNYWTVETFAGLRLKIKACAKELPTGDFVVGLRPERVRLINSETQVDNAFIGTIKDVLYLGEAVKVKLQVLAHEITMKLSAPVNPNVLISGNQVRIGWNAGDATTIPKDLSD